MTRPKSICSDILSNSFGRECYSDDSLTRHLAFQSDNGEKQFDCHVEGIYWLLKLKVIGIFSYLLVENSFQCRSIFKSK